MRPLQRFERRLEGIVSGVFARAFKGDVEPIELAAALKREIDNTARILSRDRRLVPNHFTIELGPGDFERLNAYGQTLNHELANELRPCRHPAVHVLRADRDRADPAGRPADG